VRILVGLLGIVLSLPWFVAFGVFRQNFPPPQQRLAGLLGVAFGIGAIVSAGSLFKPSWYRAAVAVLIVYATSFVILWVASLIKRRPGKGQRGEP
jgi:hypothetical protein